MAANKYRRKLNDINKRIAQEQYTDAVLAAGRGVESLLKELFDELLKASSSREALELNDALMKAKLGGNMTLGRWAWLYREHDIYRRLEKTFGYTLKGFNSGALGSVNATRNECAHDDFEPSLTNAELILSQYKLFLEETGRAPQLPLPEAEPPPPPEPVAPARPDEPRPWREVAVPHYDIRERRFDLGSFAIHLGDIAFGGMSAQPEYADPGSFFDLTFITRGLRSQLITMMGRLAGKPTGYSTVQLDTTFGGGKTHTLLAMYHLAKSGPRLRNRPEIRGLMNEARVEDLPDCAVAVLDGSYLGPREPRVMRDGTELRTLWGEMAYQLGGLEAYEKIRASDENRTAPGAGALRELLADLGGPSLILMDEVLDYATKAAAVRVGRNTFLVDQTQSFLKALTQAVDRHGSSMLVLTLTSSPQQIFGEEAKRLQRQIAEQESIFRNILDRVQRSEVTAENTEIYEILRRRLFEDLGDAAEHEKTADKYRDYYRKHRDRFPDHVRAPEYRSRIALAYPFHPDLIDVLQNRWGSIQSFQKTRGVLRLLALVVGRLYRNQHNAPLIHSGHIDLSEPEIRKELLDHVDNRNGYDAAIGSDIAGQADSKARRRDQSMSHDYHRYGVCEGLATAMFMYSHSGASGGFIGGTRPQLWLSVLHPAVEAALASDAYSALESELWYMERAGAHARIGVEPNLNQMLVEFRDSVAQDVERARDAIYDAIKDMAGGELGKAIVWPADPRQVRDKDSLQLVIAPLESAYSPNAEEDKATSYIKPFLESAGSRHRVYSNSLVFLLPSRGAVDNIQRAAITLLALRDIAATRGDSLKGRQQEELRRQLNNAEEGLPAAIWGAYTVTAAAGSQGEPWIREESGIKTHLPGLTLAPRALHRLESEDRLLERFDPEYLLMRASDRFKYLWPAAKPAINTLELWKQFARYDYLPMLRGRDVLQETIAKGVDQGKFAYCAGDPEQSEAIHIDKTLTPAQCAIGDEAWLLDAELARQRLKPAPAAAIENGERPATAPAPDEAALPGTVAQYSRPRRPSACQDIDIEIELKPDDWRAFHQSIIQPLLAKDATLQISVRLQAARAKGFEPDFVELNIREGASQISPSALVKTGEPA